MFVWKLIYYPTLLVVRVGESNYLLSEFGFNSNRYYSLAMTTLDRYIQAATRDNTRKSYRSAIEHYETVWGGFLPATADSVARYLADHAESLSLNTLKQRLAALATWHKEQGFVDPTKATLVKKVMKGIAECHPALEKRAKPLQLNQLKLLVSWIDQQREIIGAETNHPRLLKLTRDKALILMGFWRAFRSDELTRLAVEHIQIYPGQGMECYLPRSKTDRQSKGTHYKAPALSQLCPVDAYLDWITLSGLNNGPVFRSINRWGHIGSQALHPDSLVSLLRHCFTEAGIVDSDEYSSHSLRRGFASWANANQWDVKSLMEYVGWKDVQSAMRYIETPDAFGQQRIEQGLNFIAQDSLSINQATTLDVFLHIERFNKQVRTMKKTRELIERVCFAHLSMERDNDNGSRYRITVAHESAEQLDEIMDELLHQMHVLANDHQCMLEVTVQDPLTERIWD